MRSIIVLILLLTAALSAGAQNRSYFPEAASAPPCESSYEGTDLGCSITECIGYGTASLWASEIQVEFVLPDAPQGGPWLIDRVEFFLSGSGEHQVVIRQPGSGSPAIPGVVVDETIVFTPPYESWPPDDWTYVALAGAFPPYASYLVLAPGERFCVGLRLSPEDAIGLSRNGETPSSGWASMGSEWLLDSAELGIYPAVRLGLIDLGSSSTESQNWGIIKTLFR
ncbi:MAG: hypothetical protein KBD56_05165 [Candidatus Eisenbacteria bacterium]|nr:hypothetical protein [Candidatus Eisenbacteria bacterium]